LQIYKIDLILTLKQNIKQQIKIAKREARSKFESEQTEKVLI